MVAGHSGKFTPGGYLSAVIHTALAGIEPTTFRLLVWRATSRATLMYHLFNGIKRLIKFNETKITKKWSVWQTKLMMRQLHIQLRQRDLDSMFTSPMERLQELNTVPSTITPQWYTVLTVRSSKSSNFLVRSSNLSLYTKHNNPVC